MLPALFPSSLDVRLGVKRRIDSIPGGNVVILSAAELPGRRVVGAVSGSFVGSRGENS
jgi:hypothetical protein